MYNNLVYFLVPFFLFTASGKSLDIHPSFALTTVVTLLFLGGFALFCKFTFKNTFEIQLAERRSFYCAIFLFTLLCYGMNLRNQLDGFSIDGNFSLITDTLGLLVFLLFSSILWYYMGKTLYRGAGSLPPKSYVYAQFRVNLPIILPWGIFSGSQNILMLLPTPHLHSFIETTIGHILFVTCCLLLLLFYVPIIVPRLWGCAPLKDQALDNELQEFCKKLHFSAQIRRWPLMNGQVIAGGVIGVLPRVRYILLTPGIIRYMEKIQIKAVLAHEIGHVKHKHILFYLLLIISFNFLLHLFAAPLTYLLLSSQTIIQFSLREHLPMHMVFNLVSSVLVLVIVVIFFRYIFNFFIRNFERQADFYTIEAMQSVSPLVSAFQRIAHLTGTKIGQTNWHHSRLDERIAALKSASYNPSEITQHTKKVQTWLCLYFSIIFIMLVLSIKLLPASPEIQWHMIYTKAKIEYYSQEKPKPHPWKIPLDEQSAPNTFSPKQ